MQRIVRKENLEEIGTVIFKRSSRARMMRIRISQHEGIIVTMPLQLPESVAFRFLNEKKSWILQSLKKQERIKNKLTLFTENISFTTRWHTLFLYKHDKNTIKSVVSGGKIVVWYPSHATVEDDRIQRIIRRAIIEAWRAEAKKYLPARTTELAQKYNFRYNNLSLKNTKTRWGSCSAKNNINLNIQLMRLPERLTDYIILHELAHTQHKNHKNPFWTKMEQMLPNARNLDKELNNYHLEYW